MSQIRPFEITIAQERIEKLKTKLKNTVLPDDIEPSDWSRGVPLFDLQSRLAYWRDQYSWKATEIYLNTLPNFLACIDVDGFGTIDLHFLHYQSEILVLRNLGPGNFLEVTKLPPFLQTGGEHGNPAFHVIAPSLPNFGFSSKVLKAGFGLKQYAETCHKLMLALGYEQYVTQGGDWGAVISRIMAQLYPQSVKALHLNLVPSRPPSVTSPFSWIKFITGHVLGLYTSAEVAGLERSKEYQKSGMGYYQIMISKPQTLGYLLADSPAGLLAWIYEKLHDWTDNYDWTEDEICTWVSLYWFSTAGPSASIQIYYEAQRGERTVSAGGYLPNVKLGLAYYPKDIFRFPKAWGESLGHVVYTKEHDRGGHFAAWERPESLASDLQVMFGRNGGAYGVVDNRDGYV